MAKRSGDFKQPGAAGHLEREFLDFPIQLGGGDGLGGGGGGVEALAEVVPGRFAVIHHGGMAVDRGEVVGHGRGPWRRGKLAEAGVATGFWDGRKAARRVIMPALFRICSVNSEESTNRQ